MRHLFLLLLLCGGVSAQTVTGVSGAVSHGDTITVSGYGFGTKDRAGPEIYDSLEQGSLGVYENGFPATIGHWETAGYGTGTLNGVLSTSSLQRHQYSSYIAWDNMAGSEGENGNHAYFRGGTPARSWFVSYWFMLDENFDQGTQAYPGPDMNLANLKMFRLWQPGGGHVEDFFVGAPSPNWNYMSVQVENVPPDVITFESGAYTNWQLGEWRNFQIEFRDATAGYDGSGGGEDGVVRIWIDHDLVYENTSFPTFEDDGAMKRPYFLGYYDAHNDSDSDPDYFYIDEAYVDSSWARVEIGNASIYSSCTHRELQIPTAWSDTELSVQVHVGEFDLDSTLYLFVIGEDGARSSGYPISGSGESPGTPDIQSATRSGTNAVLEWSAGDGGPYTAWLAESGVELQGIATSDTSATIPIGTGAIDVTVHDGTTVRRANIAEAE